MPMQLFGSRALALGMIVAAMPFSVACQGQMRESVSYRAMERPLEVPADSVAMNDTTPNLDYPPGDTGGPPNPYPATAFNLDLGKRKYEAQCGPCHGNTGTGDGKVGAIWLLPPPALDNARFKAMSDGQMYLRIVKGGAANGTIMPSYAKKLTEEERWAVVNYIKQSIAK
ncbi:MAG: cytochrome c [Candidatus Sericytochromatia bacterium]|nr:cytochrome c [Candidatus Tanganyikabacteria bacterium]